MVIVPCILLSQCNNFFIFALFLYFFQYVLCLFRMKTFIVKALQINETEVLSIIIDSAITLH